MLPYERFIRSGSASCSNAELLAIILRTGTRNESALELSEKILTLHGGSASSLSVLHELTLEDLLRVNGIGQVKAVKILCLAELSRRMAMERASAQLTFASPDSVAQYYMESLRHESQEKTILLLLTSRLTLIREETLSIGSAVCTVLSPRDVFRRALQAGAVNIILLHNHPSGDPAPSEQDRSITRQIAQIGQMMEITLADHIIIGDRCYYSMKEQGII